MTCDSLRRSLLLLVIASCAACVPLPFSHYFPEAPGGKLFYVTCSFNKHVPSGIEFTVDGVRLQAGVWPREGRQFIELRFDVPDGKTVQLGDDRITFAPAATGPGNQARFDKVSLVDTPIVNIYNPNPEIQRHMVAVAAPMVGKTTHFPGQLATTSWPRHFWLATYFSPYQNEDIFMTLPAFTVNGMKVEIPQIHFRKELFLGVALMNC